MMETKEKEKYRFYHNGQATEWSDFLAVFHAGQVSNETYLERLSLREIWLDGHEVNERAWARAELAATDFMELPTATYKGERLATSSKLSDILAYREKIRLYNHREEQRPKRPEWFLDDNT